MSSQRANYHWPMRLHLERGCAQLPLFALAQAAARFVSIVGSSPLCPKVNAMPPSTSPHGQSTAVAHTTRVWVPALAYWMTGGEAGTPTPLLPETSRLLERLKRLASADGLDGFGNPSPNRITSYCALPKPNLPELRFQISGADPKLLTFVGKAAPGFEVLEVLRAGFQYHWRQDLVRTFDERLPFIGRMCWLSGTGEVVIEHLSLPVLHKGRVREIRGWLVFSQDLADGRLSPRAEEIGMFRRLERSRPLQLPPALTRPGAENTGVHRMLRRLTDRWCANSKLDLSR